MKKYLLLCAFGFLASSLYAGDNLQNGSFDNWGSVEGNPPVGEATSWLGGKPVQAPGITKEFRHSALLRGNTEIYQALDSSRGFPASFELKQTVAIIAGTDEWQQPLRITLQESGADGKFDGRHNWIQLRITKERGSRTCSIEVRSGEDSTWKPVAKDVIPLTDYDGNGNTYLRAAAFDIVVSRKADAKTYSVSYGESGQRLKTVDGLRFFAERSNGSQRLAFVSYAAPGKDSQYLVALGGVSVVDK